MQGCYLQEVIGSDIFINTKQLHSDTLTQPRKSVDEEQMLDIAEL